MVNLVEKIFCIGVLERISRMQRYLRLEPEMAVQQGAEVLKIFVTALHGILDNLDPLSKRLSKQAELDKWEKLATVRRLSDISNSVDEMHSQLQFVHGPWVRPETRVFIKGILEFIPEKRRPKKVSVILSNSYSFEESDLSSYFQYALSTTNVGIPIQTETPTVFLPKIERDNPLNWANLVHECGHADYEGIRNLLDKQHLIPDKADAETRDTLRHWAEEIYCDVFATQILGPAYLASFATFAMALAGAAGSEQAFETHPADIVRICIVRDLLEKNKLELMLDGQWQVFGDLASFFYNCLEDRTKLDRSNTWSSGMSPQPPIVLHDFVDAACEEMSQLVSLSQQLHPDDFSRIRPLVEKRLAKGIPISSYSKPNPTGSPDQVGSTADYGAFEQLKNAVQEHRTFLWEIVNSGWLYKVEYLYPSAFGLFFNNSSSPLQERVDMWGKEIENMDGLLLKSIESSEIQRLLEME